MAEGSKRSKMSNERAQKVCRELRYLIAVEGQVNDNNSGNLMKYLLSWMNVTGKDKYERPS